MSDLHAHKYVFKLYVRMFDAQLWDIYVYVYMCMFVCVIIDITLKLYIKLTF